MSKKIRAFLSHRIWRLDVRNMSWLRSLGVRTLRILLLTYQGFSKKQVQLGASALTYYSLLAVIPIIALLIGVARGFLLEDDLNKWLLAHFGEQKEVVNQIIVFAQKSLEQIKGGLMAGIGLLILLWAAIKILKNIEFVLNGMWEVKHPRSLAKQFSDYLAMIFICPLIVLLAGALTVYFSTRLNAWEGDIPLFQFFGPVLFFFLNLSPYVLTTLLFTFIYIFMPNTRVRLSAGIWAGIIAGTIYQLVQWAYVTFQINMASYNAIYGTFAAFPLFLIWVHLSWVIVLLGAKIAFAFQNANAYESISEDFDLSHNTQMLVALRIAHNCIRRFCDNLSAPTSIELSNSLSIPLHLATDLTYLLVEANVLAEIKGKSDADGAFIPAREVSQLTIKKVIDMIENRGEPVEFPPSKELSILVQSLEKFNALIEASDANIALNEIKES